MTSTNPQPPTIGIARAQATITLANMAFNMKRWVFLKARNLPA